MRRPFIASVVTVAAMSIGALGYELASAQAQPLPTPPRGLETPAAAPVKPYKPVAVTPPAALSDPSFEAFRKQLADIAGRKDRAGLTKLMVAQGFFWLQQKDVTDKKKPAIENLAKAIDLDNQDGSGWAVIAGYAGEPTAGPMPAHQGVMCAPGNPTFDPKAFQALIQSTKTDFSEWSYPVQDGVDVHAAAQASSPVSEKLGMNLVRVLPDSAPPDNPNDPFFLHVAPPSAKAGFVDAQMLAPLAGDKMCYVKDSTGWKITGYIGGDQ